MPSEKTRAVRRNLHSMHGGRKTDTKCSSSGVPGTVPSKSPSAAPPISARTAAGVLIASYIDRVTSHRIGSIVLLAMFFSGLVVSWIATVFVMDGSLNNFFAEREQLEAERVGKLYMNRTNPKD